MSYCSYWSRLGNALVNFEYMGNKLGLLEMFKGYVKHLLGIQNYDREGEARIRKMYQLYAKGGFWNKFRAMRLCNKIRKDYNVNVHPSTKVGDNLYIAHCYSFGIGKTSIIGNNVRIYPNVHIAASKPIGAKGGRRHAKIGDNCVLGINSTILGPITIGNNVIIGANALVTKDVPDNSVVTGVNQIRPLRGDELISKTDRQ